MNALQKEETIQAVLIADAYDKILQPFVNEGNTVSGFNCISFVYDVNTDENKEIQLWLMCSICFSLYYHW